MHCNGNDDCYTVDVDLGLCSCLDGADGKFCKHLFTAFLGSKLQEPVAQSITEAETRILLEIVKKSDSSLGSRVLLNNQSKRSRVFVFPCSYKMKH